MPVTTPRTHPLRDGTCTAYDHGAQLAAWEQHGEPVLYLSGLTRPGPGTAIRGGVPICWPWFGPGRDGAHSPAHGFARIAPWRLVDEVADGEAVRWAWELTPADVDALPGRDRWRHDFHARCQVEVGDQARVALTVANTGAEPFDYEVALHSYLAVGDVARVRVTGLSGATWFDKVTGGVHEPEGTLRLRGETDRIYHTADPVEVHDPVRGRTLSIASEGARDTVVWNPGPEKGQDIGDMAPDDWHRMMCVEAGNVAGNAVVLAPGATWTTATTITVTRYRGEPDEH